MVSKLKYGWTLLGIFSFSASSYAQNNAEFLEFYPDCGFEIVDTVKHTGMIRSDFKESPQFYISNKMKELHQDILKKAQENGVQYLVVKSRELIPAYDESMRFHVTVEHLKTCSAPHELGGKAAEFDALGQKLASFGQMKIGEDKTITFSIPQSIVRPELNSNVNVSFTDGLYGVKLGTARDEVIKVFGTPSFWSSDNEGMELIAYGRRHWLTFQNGVLVAAKFGKSLFNEELMNQLTFDDRFDDRKWIAGGTVKRNEALASIDASDTPSFNTPSQSLTLDTQVFLENQREERNRRVIGFELKTKDSTPIVFDSNQLSKPTSLDYLYTSLSTLGEFTEIDSAPLLQSSLGKTSKDNGRQYLLIDANTLVETAVDGVKKILISSSYIDGISPTWHFGPFYAGQSLDDALAAAGDNAFYMLDVIEIDHDRYTIKLFTSEEDSGTQIYAMEVSIF